MTENIRGTNPVAQNKPVPFSAMDELVALLQRLDKESRQRELQEAA
jgi:hypothetical protein